MNARVGTVFDRSKTRGWTRWGDEATGIGRYPCRATANRVVRAASEFRNREDTEASESSSVRPVSAFPRASEAAVRLVLIPAAAIDRSGRRL